MILLELKTVALLQEWTESLQLFLFPLCLDINKSTNFNQRHPVKYLKFINLQKNRLNLLVEQTLNRILFKVKFCFFDVPYIRFFIIVGFCLFTFCNFLRIVLNNYIMEKFYIRSVTYLLF